MSGMTAMRCCSRPARWHLATATLYRHFYAARDAAGRPDLRFHDLRHTGAVLAAATGATLAELMGRLGHSTPAAAMRYQHVASGADQALAERMSKLSAHLASFATRCRELEETSGYLTVSLSATGHCIPSG